MERLRNQIHTAFTNVSSLCDHFFTKFPHFAPPNYTNQSNPNYDQRNYSRLNQTNQSNPWISDFKLNGMTYPKNNKYQNENSGGSFNLKLSNKDTSKTYEKKNQQKRKREQLRIQRLREYRRQMKVKSKTDVRFQQKPKYPTSPYFRFLQVMREAPQHKQFLKTNSNRAFTEQMGQKWRGMTEQQKKPYISGFVEQKRRYDRQIKIFYQKFPDLSPKWRLQLYQKEGRQGNFNNYGNFNSNSYHQLQEFTPELKSDQLGLGEQNSNKDPFNFNQDSIMMQTNNQQINEE